jgi:hypothetical protein
MNLGKLIKKHDQLFIRDLGTSDLHHAPSAIELKLGAYYSYDVNEDDDAVDLKDAATALLEYGIQPSTGSFYSVGHVDSDDDEEPWEDVEAFYGQCQLTGLQGDVAPCQYLDSENKVIDIEVGTWLIHTVLGKLAGAF